MTRKTKDRKKPTISAYQSRWLCGIIYSYEQGYTSREILIGSFKRIYGETYKQVMKKYGV